MTRDMAPKNTRRRQQQSGSLFEKMPAIKPGFQWFVRALLIALLLIPVYIGYDFYSYAMDSERFEIELEIEGLQALDEDRVITVIEQLVNDENGSNKSLFSVSAQEIQNILLTEISRFRDVSVRRRFPDTLFIDVQERRPEAIAIVRSSETNRYVGKLIDRQGVLFAPTSSERDELIEILPRIVGLAEARNNAEFDQMWQRILEVKETTEEIFSPDILDVIKILPAGYSVTIEINRPRQLEIRLGAEQYRLKIEKLYDLMNTEQFREMGDYIDLSDPNKIYTGESRTRLIPRFNTGLSIG